MKQVDSWDGRAPGCLGFANDVGALPDLIRDAEHELRAPGDTRLFCPTHAFLFGPHPGEVTEATLSLRQNGAAVVAPEAKYKEPFASGAIQIHRPAFPESTVAAAFDTLRRGFGGDPYAVLNLVGFGYEALVRLLFGIKVGNPEHQEQAEVCSQTVLAFVSIASLYCAKETWVRTVGARNCTPDSLLGAVLAQESGE